MRCRTDGKTHGPRFCCRCTPNWRGGTTITALRAVDGGVSDERAWSRAKVECNERTLDSSADRSEKLTGFGQIRVGYGRWASTGGKRVRLNASRSFRAFRENAINCWLCRRLWNYAVLDTDTLTRGQRGDVAVRERPASPRKTRPSQGIAGNSGYP